MAYNNIFAFHAAQKPVEQIVQNMEVSSAKFYISFAVRCLWIVLVNPYSLFSRVLGVKEWQEASHLLVFMFLVVLLYCHQLL